MDEGLLNRVLGIIAGVVRIVGRTYMASQAQMEDCEAELSLPILERLPTIEWVSPEGWVSKTAWGKANRYFKKCAKKRELLPAELGIAWRGCPQSRRWRENQEQVRDREEVELLRKVLDELDTEEREVVEAWLTSSWGKGAVSKWGKQKGYSRAKAFALFHKAKSELRRYIVSRKEEL